jgi:mRNA-degrading endonuclease RelE of RelBE toxin-antitoxin system
VSVTVRITKSFKTVVKPLLKKYPSLKNDLLELEQALIDEPKLGTSLGNNAYKIRLKIASKGKGKSGGARVISLIETVLIGEIEVKDEEITVNLLTIYDKADTANITDKELRDLIKIFHNTE